ncbi:MAG TPA: hypothetical protein VJ793_10130 [Anaerolineae bacterium]|nr:hypothetical protein [Anaerolineae bacterium]
MTFTVSDYADLVRLLNEHPEWRAELRRLLLSDELLTLPDLVRELADAQRRIEVQFDAMREQVRLLVETVQALTDSVRGLKDVVGDLNGKLLALTYRDRVGAYFGPLLRRVRAVEAVTLEDELEAHLSHEEFKDVLLLDLLVSGRPRHLPEADEVWLAVEVSSVVDREDVTRARRRAELLRRAGYRAVPTVAGEKATLGAEDDARQHTVVMLQDGRAYFWNEALQVWA